MLSFSSPKILTYVMHIPILTGVQKTRIGGWNGHFLLKNLHVKLNYQDEGHLYASCLFYILSIYLKFLLFKSHSHGISLQQGFKKGTVAAKNKIIFC